MPLKKSLSRTWMVPVLLTLGLLLGYAFGEGDPAVDPNLKGLSLFEHFSTHWLVGIFFGLLIATIYLCVTRRRLSEPLLLSATILWAHFPDIRFAFRHEPHESWEAIFFFHTTVDELPGAIGIFLFLNLIAIAGYFYLITVDTGANP